MHPAAQLSEIDWIVAGACALACCTLILLWRQRRQQRLLDRLHARAQRERGTREQLEQALTDTRRQVCHLSASQQSLRDAERRRIARDLHDDLGQHLLLLGLELRALGASQPGLQQSVDRIDGHVQQTLAAMRSIVRDLQPQALEYGLQQAVSEQLEQFSRLSGIVCHLDASADDFDHRDSHDTGMDKILYRILQESLSNIARHAQASQVMVAISRASDSMRLTVRDDGVGLPPALPPSSTLTAAAPAAARAGYGLRGIAERVSEAGGRFDIASTPGQGTALTMSFPLH
ncbi:MAG: sensor histidine kinase [Duganella sp.]